MESKMEQVRPSFVAFEVFHNTNDPLDVCNDDDVDLFLAYKAVSDPDTLYFHEARQSKISERNGGRD